MSVRIPPTRQRNRTLGADQPTPSGLHRTDYKPWTEVVRAWLAEAGATAAETSAVLHDLVEAKAIPPTRERAVEQLQLVRAQVAAYLESGEEHSPHDRDLADDQRRRQAEEQAAREREVELRRRAAEREAEARAEAERIERAREHARSKARIEAAARDVSDDTPEG